MERLKYIEKIRGNSTKKNYFKPLKYPQIPLSIDDIYVTTTAGDRLDLLAHQFYKDVDLWWVITTANPDIIRRDSFNLKGGLEIRIPTDIENIITLFELTNVSDLNDITEQI